MNTNIIKKANDFVNRMDTACIGVIDENGYPSVSTVSSIKTDGIFCAYFSTGLDANKTKRLQNCDRTSVCYTADGNNVTLVGEAEILTDQKTKSDLWVDWFVEHFPHGETDPNYCIIKFTTKRISLWIDNESAETTIDYILEPKARCGGICEPFSCKEKYGTDCQDCFHSHPFWGSCPVKECCEAKAFTHCGECDDMPCEMLYDFSCGDGDECDVPKGSRIEMLRRLSDRRFYQVAVIEESLNCKDILDKIEYCKFKEYVSESGDQTFPEWHINGYIFSHSLLLRLMDELKAQIRPDWYIHAFNEMDDVLYVVLKGRVFKLPCKRDGSWDEMIAYGENMGLERKWTEDIPMRA